MQWWGLMVLLIALAGLLTAATLAVQAKRRGGTVIAVRSARYPRREGPR
ncbi:hypothetical protein [Streptomyces sp. NPDC001153]